MIRHVLFDLDDTLCDFAGARRRGLTAAFAPLEPTAAEAALRLWGEVEPGLYRYFSRRVLSRDGYRRLRFAAVLSAVRGTHAGAVPEPYDLDNAAGAMNHAFMTEVNDRVKPVPGAVQCLRALAEQGVGCHVLTNGPLDGQQRKLTVTGLRDLVDRVYVSEELGVAKPDPEVFRRALADLGVPADQVLMVGDSFEYDVAPARAAGLPALWYAPEHPAGEGGVVRDLTEVPDAAALL